MKISEYLKQEITDASRFNNASKWVLLPLLSSKDYTLTDLTSTDKFYKDDDNAFIVGVFNEDFNRLWLRNHIFILVKPELSERYIIWMNKMIKHPMYSTHYLYQNKKSNMYFNTFVFEIDENTANTFREGKFYNFSDAQKTLIRNFTGSKKIEDFLIDKNYSITEKEILPEIEFAKIKLINI